MDLSIVVPAYNEEHRIGATLADIERFIGEHTGTTEVIVVDDGSTDATSSVAAASPIEPAVIRFAVNRGKGRAVRTGMLAATGRRRLFTDADGSTPIDEYRRLASALDSLGDSGIAFASVAVPGAEVVTPQRGLRPAAGRMGNRLIQALVLPGVADSQRGFKLFTADAAQAVFTRCVVDRWAFDVESLAIARALGIPIVEVPVTWEHKDDSRVTAASYLTTLRDVVAIRRRISRGAHRSISSHPGAAV